MRRHRLLAAGVAAAGGLAVVPLVVSPYGVIIVSHALILAIACLGVNLLLGYAGLLSLGHAAFFGLGAYAGGFLRVFGFLGSFETYLLSGLAASAVLAALIGALCVRATRIYFAVLTLAFGQVIHSLFVAGHVFRLAGAAGQGLYFVGEGGLYLPRLTMAGHEISAERFPTVLYYIIAAAFLGATLVMWRIVHSPFGAALQAIRDNETRARFVGIPVGWSRWLAFVIAGTFAGLAGALAGELDRQVTTEQLHWLLSADFVVAIVAGGSRHFLGPVLGAFLMTILEEFALSVSLYHGLTLGALLIAVVFVFPSGVAGLLAQLSRSRGAEPRAVAPAADRRPTSVGRGAAPPQ
ncbi:MAG TPA: branched-chain amino acid ABC transporter permease [Methylomirabilota bacterium]|nr:branched-chain amino acid ABC transporter permease [Methylomirabilota bacterium]